MILTSVPCPTIRGPIHDRPRMMGPFCHVSICSCVFGHRRGIECSPSLCPYSSWPCMHSYTVYYIPNARPGKKWRHSTYTSTKSSIYSPSPRPSVQGSRLKSVRSGLLGLIHRPLSAPPSIPSCNHHVTTGAVTVKGDGYVDSLVMFKFCSTHSTE